LRGVLERAGNLRIVRLVRVGGRFVGRLVDNELIKVSLRRPAARSETILDGIFADAVTIVEADTDRVAYQAAFELGPRPARRDIYFAAVGGVGGIAETAAFYCALHIPIAVIADLDLILVPQSLGRILQALAGGTIAEELTKTCEALQREIREVPPDLSDREIERRLVDVAEVPFEWAKNHDEAIVKSPAVS
jgi:hypothetical protein